MLDSTGRNTIYIVDDDEAVRDSLRVLLESHGLPVREFASARGFLAQMDGHANGCLLLDLHMPEMGGIDVLDILRGRGAQLPVIVITGRGDSTLEELALKSGAIALLHKPVGYDELCSSLERAFATTRPR